MFNEKCAQPCVETGRYGFFKSHIWEPAGSLHTAGHHQDVDKEHMYLKGC